MGRVSIRKAANTMAAVSTPQTHAPALSAVREAARQQRIRVPDWVYGFTDEQFVHWCRQHKLVVCDGVREFTDDERAAIFRYASRQQLVN
jgi:hypothetical protein